MSAGLDREASLSRIDVERGFDVLIVGGGATGLGAAVDAAARGWRTVLVEAEDFAAGTSSRSTKLVHGGVRYLRQGDVRLVVHALRERGLLFRNAPHLVRELGFVIPAYRFWHAPFYGIGLKLYDLLAGRLALAPSRHLSRDETLRRLPTLDGAALRGSVVYHDAQFDDARLAIDLAKTAAGLGAVLVNHAPAVRLLRDGGRVGGAIVRDAETGREHEIRSRAVINAAGAFTDAVRRLDDPEATEAVVLSRGSHIVLPRRFLPGADALMVPRTDDGRVLFAIPWHGRVVVGTTDVAADAAESEPRASAGEIGFLLEHTARYLTEKPDEGDVLAVFAGLRPLVRASATRTAALSRDHTILVSGSGLVTITGGKWTTYRRMAEDAIDRVEDVLGEPRRPCRTATLSIHGGATAPHAADDPLSVYGTDAEAVRAIARAHPDLGRPLDARLPYVGAEVVWAARAEMARTVEDVLGRRTRALLLDARAAADAAPAVAHLLARELGRDEAWEQRSVDAFRTLALRYVPGRRI